MILKLGLKFSFLDVPFLFLTRRKERVMRIYEPLRAENIQYMKEKRIYGLFLMDLLFITADLSGFAKNKFFSFGRENASFAKKNLLLPLEQLKRMQ